ncbi:MAG: hypothetical protein HQL82_04565 [Magnetococcales bacterium]|nr:hypothetical protein [Magnetococcales bacterium]
MDTPKTRWIRWLALPTPEEGRMALKLAACLLLAMLLYLTDIAVRFPQDMFLYGRF